MGASLRLGRILGIPVEINASWLVVFLLLTFVLAQEFSEANLNWPAAQRWLVAIVMVVLFFMSVLIHELSHSILARSKGIPVQGITLFIFGGVSRLSREPNRPLTEASVAIVGPVTSLLLAGFFWRGLVLAGRIRLRPWSGLVPACLGQPYFGRLQHSPRLPSGWRAGTPSNSLGTHRQPPAGHLCRHPGRTSYRWVNSADGSCDGGFREHFGRCMDRHRRCVSLLRGHRQLPSGAFQMAQHCGKPNAFRM